MRKLGLFKKKKYLEEVLISSIIKQEIFKQRLSKFYFKSIGYICINHDMNFCSIYNRKDCYAHCSSIYSLLEPSLLHSVPYTFPTFFATLLFARPLPPFYTSPFPGLYFILKMVSNWNVITSKQLIWMYHFAVLGNQKTWFRHSFYAISDVMGSRIELKYFSPVWLFQTVFSVYKISNFLWPNTVACNTIFNSSIAPLTK